MPNDDFHHYGRTTPCEYCKKQEAKINRLVWLGMALGVGWFTFAVVTFP